MVSRPDSTLSSGPKLVLFYLRPLEIVDQDREPSEKLGSQIEEQV